MWPEKKKRNAHQYYWLVKFVKFYKEETVAQKSCDLANISILHNQFVIEPKFQSHVYASRKNLNTVGRGRYHHGKFTVYIEMHFTMTQPLLPTYSKLIIPQFRGYPLFGSPWMKKSSPFLNFPIFLIQIWTHSALLLAFYTYMSCLSKQTRACLLRIPHSVSC